MQVREVYDLIIFPKVFMILNFYSKGLYSLQISLTAEQETKGTQVKGFPFFIQGVDAVKSQQKKAKISFKDNKISYTSENFYVTFSSQNFYFHTLPFFRIQLDKLKRYKIWIDFNLILTSYKITKNKDQKLKQSTKDKKNYLSLNTVDEKVTLVDSKRLFLNGLQDLNTYQRIHFSQPDYFSYTDAFIYSIKSQTAIRPYQFSLYQFHKAPVQERSRFHLVKSQQLKCLLRSLKSGNIKQIEFLIKQGLIKFYQQMIEQPIKRYKKLAHIFQHFRAMMFTLNNSTIIQETKIPYLQNILKYLKPQQQSSQPQQATKNHQQTLNALYEYYQSDNQAEIYVEIFHQSQCITKNIRWLFKNLCNLLIKINYNVFQLLSQPTIRDKWEVKQSKFIYHGDITKEKRIKHSQFLNFRKSYCQSQKVVQDGDLKHPFIMFQGFNQSSIQQLTKKQGIPSYVIDNLVVFVHGYQGSDYDLQIAKYNVQMYNSHSYCLMSTSIQDQMDQSIEYLGVQLATQIRQHITHSYNSYKRINFVGYSLGGIVIRESIKHLSQFKEKMNMFISLASPHTGTIDGGNFLIKTGIWYLINFQNAKNIKQLHCQFQGKQEQNFILKKLSQCESLEWFNKFVVVSSQQDSFVPYSSSRIDQLTSSTITKLMCENIRKRIKKFQRVEVWFDVDAQSGTIDKMLGRKAHIQFLQNKVFLSFLFKVYASQF